MVERVSLPTKNVCHLYQYKPIFTMKTILIVLFLSCIFAGSDAFPGKSNSNVHMERFLSNAMLEKLENLRDLIHNGNETLGIPVLDPWTHESVNLNFDNSALKLIVNAEDIILAGIGDFIVSSVDISLVPLAVKFDGSFPLTKLSAESYALTGKIFNALPIYGKGRADFAVGALDFVGNAKVSVGLSGVTLKDLRLQLSLGSFKSETTGMLGGGDIDNVINAILEDMVPDFFNNNADLISDTIGETILLQINKVLDGMSLADLIDLITG